MLYPDASALPPPSLGAAERDGIGQGFDRALWQVERGQDRVREGIWFWSRRTWRPHHAPMCVALPGM